MNDQLSNEEQSALLEKSSGERIADLENMPPEEQIKYLQELGLNNMLPPGT